MKLIEMSQKSDVTGRADLNFEVDVGVNDAIGTIVTKWDLVVFG